MKKFLSAVLTAVVVSVTTVMSAGVQAQTAAPAPAAAPAAAATPAPAAPAVPAAVGETKAVDNPYGIDALWAQGDAVAKGTLIILLIMSGATWYVGIMKFIEQQKLLKQGRTVREGTGSVAGKIAALGDDGPYADLLGSGKEAAQQATQAKQLDADGWVANAVADALDRVSSFLQGGMSVLATVGSTAPFVGLFGTVWGIYHALTAIGVAGQASIDKVAGPVGEALIMTAIGLAVAVPAVLGYNWLLRRNKQVIDLMRLHAGKLHAELVMSVPR